MDHFEQVMNLIQGVHIIGDIHVLLWAYEYA